MLALNRSDDALVLVEDILKKDQILGNIQKLDALLMEPLVLIYRLGITLVQVVVVG